MRLYMPAVAAAAVLVLAGCSELEPGSPLPTGGGVAPSAASSPTSSATSSTVAPEPTAETSVTPIAEPTATPTTAPTLPPEATTNDAAGAEAFVKYWFETVNFAYSTGATEPLEEASSVECRACQAILDEINGYEASNSRVGGGLYSVTEVASPAPDPTGVSVVSVEYAQEPLRILDGSGVVVTTSGGREGSLGAVLQREGETWSLYDLGR